MPRLWPWLASTRRCRGGAVDRNTGGGRAVADPNRRSGPGLWLGRRTGDASLRRAPCRLPAADRGMSDFLTHLAGIALARPVPGAARLSLPPRFAGMGTAGDWRDPNEAAEA